MLKKVLSLAALVTLISSAHAIENGRYNIVSSLSGLYLDVYGGGGD